MQIQFIPIEEHNFQSNDTSDWFFEAKGKKICKTTFADHTDNMSEHANESEEARDTATCIHVHSGELSHYYNVHKLQFTCICTFISSSFISGMYMSVCVHAFMLFKLNKVRVSVKQSYTCIKIQYVF